MTNSKMWKLKDGKVVRWIDASGKVKQKSFPSAYEGGYVFGIPQWWGKHEHFNRYFVS